MLTTLLAAAPLAASETTQAHIPASHCKKDFYKLKIETEKVKDHSLLNQSQRFFCVLKLFIVSTIVQRVNAGQILPLTPEPEC